MLWSPVLTLCALPQNPFYDQTPNTLAYFCPIINDEVLIDFHQSKVEGPVGHSLGENGDNPSLADDLVSGLSKNFLRR
jgi:hypothetical protein